MGDFDSSSPYQEMTGSDCVTNASDESQGPKAASATGGNRGIGITNDYAVFDRIDTVEDEEEHLHISNQGEVNYIPDEPEGKWFHWPTLVAYVGPGFLVCIAYLDPGNLEADLQVGAYTGYQLLWVLLLAHVMGLVLQSLAARLGVVTGTHLADVCRMYYPRPIAMMLWVMTESAIIGSDIQEVVGSAIGLQILFGIPLWLGCLLTALDTFTFLFIHVLGVRKLEALFVFLVSVMTVAFFVDFGISPPTASDVAEGFSFTLHSYALVTALGLIGAVIMPHNIYLHSALVLSRTFDRSNPKKLWEATKYYTIDSGIALTVAFLINLAVVCTFAKQFYDISCSTASTLSACFTGSSIDLSEPSYGTCDEGAGVCQEIGLSAAADALKGTLGSAAKYVWAVGLLAAGQSSTMTGTYAGQFVMEGFLRLKIPKWQRVLLTRSIALGPALAVTVYMGGDIRATDRLSAWLNVLQSLQLPFAVIPLLTFCNSRRIMGEFTIKPAMTVFVWILALFIIFVNLYIVGGFVIEQATASEDGASRLYAISGFIAALYLALIAAVVSQDLPGWNRRAGDRYTKLGGRNVSGGGGRDGDYSTLAGSSSEIVRDIISENVIQFSSSPSSKNGEDKRPLVPMLGEGSSATGGRYTPVTERIDKKREVGEGEDVAGKGDTEAGDSFGPAREAHQNIKPDAGSRV